MINNHLKYTFVNSNSPKGMENLLKEIAVEKIGMLRNGGQCGRIHPGMSWLNKEATNE